ncbi:MAG: hypothetical protein GTO51_01015 [Candidatus Latescibacteria bacterium]|nr:hypothetical protein [Candidatus Latescibacterota bacterium]NIM21579.1 hypothetical protein [Candidatus Latescibacterota bacterium]NIM64558.1 hypothetical protein [Candidatus Latescibacterota bacterium]NIO01073.1 hypothetical protein [Candidatus Latescibacterota bacterium]NIO27466.1 hypothetical protein [Candidatus Latescibacterota bacterium]
MNCSSASRLIQDYVDGRLFGLERKAFEEHLSACPACSKELEAHKALFALLDRLEPDAPPVWFEETIVRQLKLEGAIFEPKVPLPRRIAAAYGRMPGVAKYPLATLVSALLIYIPIHFMLSFAKGFAGKVAVFGSESLVAVDRTLEGISVLSRFFDIIAKDIRAVKTIFGAFFSLISSAGGGIVLPILGVIALLTLLLIRHLRTPQRRSQNASTKY